MLVLTLTPHHDSGLSSSVRLDIFIYMDFIFLDLQIMPCKVSGEGSRKRRAYDSLLAVPSPCPNQPPLMHLPQKIK